MTSSDDFYARAVAANPAPEMQDGASGYFSAPQEGLDPNLFDGTALHPEISAWLKRTLWTELNKLGLRRPAQWTFMWLAGSGISYQWAADRGNGDLDVLFGVDFPAFLRENPDWGGMSEDQFAGWLNGQLKTDLWPHTASTIFGNQAYEVTFYLNPGTGRDITRINPYAAYDLRRNSWTVTPPKVAADPASMYPRAWFDAAGHDEVLARSFVERHHALAGQLEQAVPGSAGWHNAGDALRFNADQAQTLFDDIHGNRHLAFTESGHGYGDYNNFRWQQAKQSGVINALSGIVRVRKAAGAARDAELYGGPIPGADEALAHAQVVSRERPGLRR
jgi:hypothetical protein